MSRRAAFIDRDGTINVQPPEHAYVTSAADLTLLPGALEGIAELGRCGFELFVASNQRGVGRGLLSEPVLAEIDEKLQRALRPHGARFAAFLYCPHMIDDDCDCRKPKPGLLLRAAAQHDLDLGASWMIGDTASDIEAGEAAGCRTAYVGEGSMSTATISAGSLREAAPLVCARS